MSVSVVIPAHNAGLFVDEAIESVLTQDWPADEIIVVNDGSTDRDYEQLAGVAANIRVVNQPNLGVSAARNRGCEVANGDYVAVLDADDVWLPGKLRAQMSHLELNPSCDAIFCRGRYWWPGPDGTNWPRPATVAQECDSDVGGFKRLHYTDFLYGIPVACSTMVVRKSAWQAICGYDENRRYAEDQDFYLRLSCRYRLDLLNMMGMLYRQHPHSATKQIQDPNHWADVVSRSVAMLESGSILDPPIDPLRLRRRLAELHFFHGYDHFWWGRVAIARREFLLAFRNRPLDAKTGAYLLISAIPGLAQIIRRQRTSAKCPQPQGDITSPEDARGKT